MSVFLGMLWVMAGPQVADNVVFDHIETGFQLSVPRAWKLTKTRDSHRFAFTVTGTDRAAQLEIYAATFSNDIPTWQAVQANAAKQLKREVARQWQEEILTVPMLMTRTTWEEKNGIGKTSESGLIYADTRRKFLWRLTANTEDFELALAQTRNVLQTIRTEGGKLPKPFDPTVPQSEDLRRPDRPEKRTTWKQPNQDVREPVRGDQVVETTAGNLPMTIRYSGEWTFAADGNGLSATHPSLSGKVTLRAYSSTESDPPGKALLRQSGQSLGQFDKVLKREEHGPVRSLSGSQIMMIWREGTSAAGSLFTFDVVGATGDYYWLGSWSTTDAKTASAQRDLIARLAQSMSIEPKAAGL
ncbi:MAG: hypothetical protein IT363_00845 [Methanoregulaceae archaeon]|nr:hypothetical protein [Methanoregulaceae archaeon]